MNGEIKDRVDDWLSNNLDQCSDDEWAQLSMDIFTLAISTVRARTHSYSL